jgi:hypothetical protein
MSIFYRSSLDHLGGFVQSRPVMSTSEEDTHFSEEPVLSPFSDTEPRRLKKRKKSNGLIVAGGVVCLLLVLGLGGFYTYQYLNDPLRTLEPFPVGKYLENYKPLAGAKFRAELRVENDLGWKEGVGRLMVFSLKDDPRPIVVMIPPTLAETYFTKGQNYLAELEVKEGGMIYANSCRKN